MRHPKKVRMDFNIDNPMQT